MARKFNYGSPVRQCEQAMKAVFTPGVSRHVGKADGTAGDRIYSIGTMRTYLSSNIRFARWVREAFGERFLGKVTPEMVTAFVKDLHARDLSHATVNAYVAGIAKLDVGLRAIGWRSQDAPALVGKELYTGGMATLGPGPTPKKKPKGSSSLSRRNAQIVGYRWRRKRPGGVACASGRWPGCGCLRLPQAEPGSAWMGTAPKGGGAGWCR
jgi:hypothetical protein